MALSVTAAPTKISDKPGYDTVDVHLASDETLHAWSVTLGENRDDRRLAGGGVVCGLDRVGPQALPLSATEVDTAFGYGDTGAPPDGDYTIGCHGLGDVGWT